jgi:hypothetical protein
MRTVVLAVALVGLVPAAPAQEAPRAVIEKAIAAHGGQERLAAVRADRVQLRGTIQVGQAALPFTSEVTLQLPGQLKSVVTITESARQHTLVHLLDGDKATILLDGQPQPVPGVLAAQLRQTRQLEQALRLVPLLSDPGFTLHPLPEVKYNDRVYAGVRVAGKGQRDLKLYFDRASGLLVKAEHLLDGPGGKDVVQEAFYGEYRDVGGYRRAGKVVVLRDGKKVMEAELLDARRLDAPLDPVEFTRP